MTTLNNRVWWQDRNGNPITDVTLDSFWNVFGESIDTFDPKTFNDELTGRFISVVCGNARLPSSSLMVAVSHTRNPQGRWAFGRITVDDSMGDVWIDYPSVGFTERQDHHLRQPVHHRRQRLRRRRHFCHRQDGFP